MSRGLHPGAWWIWALCLAIVASRTTNPVLLLLIVAVAARVAVSCRTPGPWSRALGMFLMLGLVVLGIRVVFHILLGGVGGPTTLFTLPEVPLPAWAASVRLGGKVSAEGLTQVLYLGMQLATMLCCVGAANALADPRRLLRSVPTALYEVSVAVTVGLTLAPQLAISAMSVRRARALRGAPVRGRHALRTLLVPVLEEAFERSMHLAATMDARGYGRAGAVTAGERRITGGLMLTGLLGLCVGAYGLLDSSAPTALGFPTLLVGVGLSAVGLRLASRRLHRSRYRPARWDARAVSVALSGAAAVVVIVLVQAFGAADAELLVPVTTPLAFPAVPLVPAVAVLGALAPLVLVRGAAR